MPRLRSIVFWSHLALGIGAGLVIAIMSATGALLALQPQILAWLERDIRDVAPSAAALPVSALAAAAAAAQPGVRIASVTIEADPSRAVQVGFTGDAGILFLDPASGRSLGGGAATARAVFRQLTEWHRWLGADGPARSTTRAVTGACNAAFCLLALSGIYLWWPRTWSRRAVRAVTTFQAGGTPRARDFNWHNVIGFWCAPILVILTATAIVMSYPWANALVYRLTASPMPSPPARAASLRGGTAAPLALDAAWTRAAAQLPSWSAMTMRLPQQEHDPVAISIVDGAHWNQYARSQLIVDGTTGDVIRWDPYARASAGQKLRGWIRFAHTGELGGIAGQLAAGIACLGGTLLVWTGWSLAIRRLAASRLLRKRTGESLAAAGAR